MGRDFQGNEENGFNEKNYIVMDPLPYEPNKEGLGCEFFKYMKLHKHKIAQYIADTEEEVTFGDLCQRAIRTAMVLQSRNLDKDDIICLCTDNNINSCIPFIASQFIGRKVCSLDPSLVKLDTTHLLSQVQPKIIFVIPESVPLIDECIKEANIDAEIVVFGSTSDHTEFAEFLEQQEDEELFQPEIVESIMDTAIILFSSGTTGLPKGICLSHYGLLCQAVNVMYLFYPDLEIRDKNVCFRNMGYVNSTSLSYATLYWISTVVFFIASMMSGTPRLICSHFDPKELWQYLDKYKISTLFLAPVQAFDMLKVGRPDGIDTTNLLTLITGGASFPDRQIQELSDLLPGTFITQAYGQTEVCGALTSFKLNNVQDKISIYYKSSSCGKPISGISYKVVDPETEEICGPNQSGELRVKTKYSMNGYYKMDSSDSYDADGWLKTGDVVYYDDDYCFYIVDRIKEMLKYRSWHVAPAMLEKVLMEHPAVKKCVVFGLPHEEDGDHPMGLVVLNDGVDVTTEEIEEFVAGKVDDRQRLRGGVKFVDDIPLTATGKARRKYIRSLVLAGEI